MFLHHLVLCKLQNKLSKKEERITCIICAEENTGEGVKMITSALNIGTRIRLELQVDEVRRGCYFSAQSFYNRL